MRIRARESRPLAATIAGDGRAEPRGDAADGVARHDGVRAGGGSRRGSAAPAGAADDADGMVSTWPIRMRAALPRALARVIAATVVPLRRAMWLTVSPERTV